MWKGHTNPVRQVMVCRQLGLRSSDSLINTKTYSPSFCAWQL